MESTKNKRWMSSCQRRALLGLCLVGCAATGGRPPAAAPDPIARFHAASGAQRWDRPLAIATTAQVTVGGLHGTSESIEDIATGRYRTTTELGALHAAEGFDGTARWEQTIDGEVVTRDTPDALAQTVTARWLVKRGYFRSAGARYRALGARSLDGRACRAIEAVPDGGAAVELWFDDATGLLARTVVRDGHDVQTTTFDDYRQVDGLALPFRTVSDSGDPRNQQTAIVTALRVLAASTAPGDAAYGRPRDDDERLRFAGARHETSVPFELINGHVYVRAAIDGQPVRLIVDTGGVNLVTPATATRLGLAARGKTAAGGGGDARVDVAYARAGALTIGDAQLADPTFYVIDLAPLAAIEEETIDGLVGFELFHRLAVRIDYPARILTLSAPAQFTPPPGAVATPFELHDRTPIVPGAIDGVPARFTIDTGAGNALTVHSPFVREHGLEARYRPRFEAITGAGVGGPTRGKPVRFHDLQIGGAHVHDVVGDLSTDRAGAFASAEAAGNLGGTVLSRFAVTFDYRARRMYLEPAAGDVPRDIYDRAGMRLGRDGDALAILGVTPGGPAERAGLTSGDRILAIDGAPVASRRLGDWRKRLGQGEVGAHHTLAIVSGASASRRDVTIVLAELVP